MDLIQTNILLLVFILHIVRDYAHEIIFQHQISAISWSQARDECTALGLELAVIKDSETWEHVKIFLSTEGLENNNIWFGLFWNFGKQKFVWVDGNDITPFFPTPWDRGTNEPNCMEGSGSSYPCPSGQSTKQNCVRLNQLFWKTRTCTKTYEYLCMKVIPETTTQLPTSTEAQTVKPTTELETTKTTAPYTTTVTRKPTTRPESISTTEFYTTKITNKPTIELYTTTKTDKPTTKLETTSTNEPISTTVINKPTTELKTTPTKGPYSTTTTNKPRTDLRKTTKTELYTSTTNNQHSDELDTLTTNGSYTTMTKKQTNDLETPENTFKATVEFKPTTMSVSASSMNTTQCIQICRPNNQRGSSLAEIYKVDRKKTGLYLRRLYSAHDGRTSSRLIGWTGVIVLCLVVACIIFIDLSRFITKK